MFAVSVRYRSKYRNRRRSSSLSSAENETADDDDYADEEAKGEPNGGIDAKAEEDTLPKAKEEAVRPVIEAPPRRRYYERIREAIKSSDEESPISEDDEEKGDGDKGANG